MSEPAAAPTLWENIQAWIQTTWDRGTSWFQEAWATAQAQLREYCAPPLRSVLEPLDRWIDGLPGYVPQVCAVSLFVIAGLAALCLRRDFVYRGAPDQARWRDLRAWSAVLMLPYITVYVLWGRGVPRADLAPSPAPAAEVASPTAPPPPQPSP